LNETVIAGVCYWQCYLLPVSSSTHLSHCFSLAYEQSLGGGNISGELTIIEAKQNERTAKQKNGGGKTKRNYNRIEHIQRRTAWVQSERPSVAGCRCINKQWLAIITRSMHVSYHDHH